MMSVSHVTYESSETEKNFLFVKCALCTKEMILTEGSVILGSEWYHKNCYAGMIKVKPIARESKHNTT